VVAVSTGCCSSCLTGGGGGAEEVGVCCTAEGGVAGTGGGSGGGSATGEGGGTGAGTGATGLGGGGLPSVARALSLLLGGDRGVVVGVRRGVGLMLRVKRLSGLSTAGALDGSSTASMM
jgi:hypothetical protein